ncbi:PleD family two-component system response regulator [candidate division KSB1 bacterium]
MKILVCEDDYMLLKTIEYKLKRDGYEVLLAPDGKTASEIIQETQVDLIITDMLMPYMSGLEVINLVRNELERDTPILVLSKIGLEETVLKAFDMGADDYMVKPFSPLELGIRVKKISKLRK